MMSAVLALAAGLLVGWLATKAHADRIRADLIEERRELDIALCGVRRAVLAGHEPRSARKRTAG